MKQSLIQMTMEYCSNFAFLTYATTLIRKMKRGTKKNFQIKRFYILIMAAFIQLFYITVACVGESSAKWICGLMQTSTCFRKTKNGIKLIFGQQLQLTTKRIDKKNEQYGLFCLSLLQFFRSCTIKNRGSVIWKIQQVLS